MRTAVDGCGGAPIRANGPGTHRSMDTRLERRATRDAIPTCDAPRRARDRDAVFGRLLARQRAPYARLMAPPLARAFAQLPLDAARCPSHADLNVFLHRRGDWSLVEVPGLIDVASFFALLRERRFPSPTWLRSEEELDYTPAPDLFHDVIGHVPQLLVPQLERTIVTLADRARGANPSELERLERVYWFTIEFGLVATEDGVRAIGAGLGSSPGELERAVRGRGVERRAFAANTIANETFQTDRMQPFYAVASSLEDLALQVERLE